VTRLALLLAFALLMGCATADPDPTGDDDDSTEAPFTCDGVTPEVTDLTPEQLAARIDAGEEFQLINVHVPYAGEIPGTDVHIPFTETADLEEHLDGDHAADAVLYCRTGPMSLQATADLVDLGYCRIYDLPAGMVGWEAAGYDLD